ncbi:anthranilate synthase component I family protein [Subtercola boreus]|nr:anthranilate synthase component I family protein [Subtercola boreus]
MTKGVLRHPLGDGIRAETAFHVLCGQSTDVFWLDGGPTSYLGAGEPFVPADGVLGALRGELSAPPRPSLALVGWLGYELLAETVGTMPGMGGRTSPHPDAAFLRVDRLVAVHSDGRAELVAAGERWEGELEQWRLRTIQLLEAGVTGDGADRADAGSADAELAAAVERATAPPPDPLREAHLPLEIIWRDTDAEYLAKIDACQSAIRAGDAYVLNLTTEITARGVIDPVAVYRELRQESPSEYGALLRIGGVSLLSASPEVFLEVGADGRVSTSPVKGTRARFPDPAADAREAEALADDPKERAENTMIVDLMRNDLTRVCVPGSVTVPSFLQVETHPHVHQLVSRVEGMLREGLGAVDAVEATFPAGSMTGTPKRSAIEILDLLEDRARGLYAGAFGFFAADGRAELAMTIRSIVVDSDGDSDSDTDSDSSYNGRSRATIGVGGGITALSVPSEELAETKLKAAALVRALRATEQAAPTAP